MWNTVDGSATSVEVGSFSSIIYDLEISVFFDMIMRLVVIDYNSENDNNDVQWRS